MRDTVSDWVFNSLCQLRYYYLENRILKAQIKGRLLLSEADKATLAEIAHRLGRKALAEVGRVEDWRRTP